MMSDNTPPEYLKNLNILSGRPKLEAINKQILDAGTIQEYANGYHNLYKLIEGTDPTFTLAISAHHDVVRQNADNCLDNTASCYNLINLCNKLINAKPRYNILCAWTDAEETCNIDLCGVNHLPIQYDYLLDLELTSCGHIWVVKHYNDKLDKVRDLFEGALELSMPYNNAVAAMLKNLNKGSTCLTLMREGDIEEVRKHYFCKRWGQCHAETDTYDNWFSRQETTLFVDKLFSRLTGLPLPTLTSPRELGLDELDDRNKA